MDLRTWWPLLSGAVAVAVAAVASAHVVLHKRDSRSAVGWVGLIWFAPFVGAALYWAFGINRIMRRARMMRPMRRASMDVSCAGLLSATLPGVSRHLVALGRAVDATGARPLTAGNRITAYDGGTAAYGAMLDAIGAAERSVALTTYIFDLDAAGQRFVDALAAAQRRGVAVRVLVDAVGAQYSLPPIDRVLRRAGVPMARFLPALIGSAYSNLRNHRKLLVVDGRVGFTGGMNIRSGHEDGSIRDLHFRLEGPVVAQLMDVVAGDWAFTTREVLQGEAWFPDLAPVGTSLCRGLTDGPDEDFENLKLVLLSALAGAQRRVAIVSPYFLPDAGLISALNVAAMRGVEVDILIPERPNLALVGWAARAQLWQVLTRGCRVFLGPAPFDHSKLMLVDGAWALFGSSNWDTRSFRLNFEFDVECYDPVVVAELDAIVAARMALARETSLAEMDARPLPVRLRDGVARLAAPYL